MSGLALRATNDAGARAELALRRGVVPDGTTEDFRSVDRLQVPSASTAGAMTRRDAMVRCKPAVSARAAGIFAGRTRDRGATGRARTEAAARDRGAATARRVSVRRTVAESRNTRSSA